MRLKYRSVPAPYSGSVESSKTEKIGRKKSKEHYLCQTFCISNCIVNVRAWAHSHVATDASLILKFETIEHMCPSTLCVWLFQRMIVWFATNEQLYYFVCFFFYFVDLTFCAKYHIVHISIGTQPQSTVYIFNIRG